jgi:predicted metalloendopeptidase
MKYYVLFSLLFLFLIFNCTKPPQSGIDRGNMDTTVRPQDDLYQHVNGKWLERTEIPADKSNYGAFTELHDESEKNLRIIIEEAAGLSPREEGTESQQVGDFYLSYIDTVLLEDLGLQPLEKYLARIDGIQSKDELIGLVAECIQTGVQTPVYFYINQDAKQSDQYISHLYQSGLGLPDRDYYFNDGEKFKEVRDKYLIYIEDIFKSIEKGNADVRAKKIMQLETALAKGHWTRVQNRDRDKTYNKYSIAELDKLTPSFSWSLYIQKADIPQITEIIVRQPTYLKQFNRVFAKYSVEDWKAYFTFKLVDGVAPLLHQELVDLHFDFHGKTLSGTESLSPRWKRAVNAVDGTIGEAVGKLYVQRHFKPEAKKRMVILVENLRKAYAERIKQLEWMSPETKEEALQKLAKFNPKIGYPNKWKDYSGLTINQKELLENVRRANIFEYKREIAKLGNPIDREEWFMTPQTVNAYYNPNMNEVVFPAAILQPPFFNMDADDAVNYGAIGAVIGHEMTHGFDDQGRKSDGDGNLRNWWQSSDEEGFNERAQVLVEQFEQFMPIDTLRINGELTLGENIADLGGLTIAYYAYQMSLDGKEAPLIDGLTGEQRFFMGWAQFWRRKYRDEELRKRLLTDPHSPSQYRIVGPMANMPEFYAAFSVMPEDEMYLPPEKRVQIW